MFRRPPTDGTDPSSDGGLNSRAGPNLDASLGRMRDTQDEVEASYPMSTAFLQLAIPIRDTLFVGPRCFSQTGGGALRRDLELGLIENGVGFWVGIRRRDRYLGIIGFQHQEESRQHH